MVTDWAFQRIFSRLFVYNILFEDSEVDGQHLGLDPSSRVLSISAAGCGVASMLRFQPRSIDTLDINHHHLALTGLKVAGAQRMASHPEFYDLFGRGWHPNPERAVRAVASGLPDWMQKYWSTRWHRFERSLYREGLTARMLARLRQVCGVDADWLRAQFGLTTEQRNANLDLAFARAADDRLVRAVVESPLQLVALGINFAQRDRLLTDGGFGTMLDVVRDHLRKCNETDLRTNWFVWYAVAGHFDHERSDAVPPYLRPTAHADSVGAPTRVQYHHRSLLDVIDDAGPNTWSHYTLCDAPDWMPRPVQRRMLEGIRRTARPGATVLMRSVEADAMPERHGMAGVFRRLDPASDAATRDDRSRQYRRVDLFEVCT
ncbi:MAG: DUF3419 family protein [Myxococcota bacterium]